MNKSPVGKGSPSELITKRIAALEDWRGTTLAAVRKLIKAADPGVVEEWKWNIPVWSHDGIICTGETYKSTVKLTFAKGAALKDPKKLFNSSLQGNVRRAIDIREGEKINEAALKALIKQAAALNKKDQPAPAPAKKKKPAKPNLLAGGNPQIAKGDGDAPVKAYISAIPGWKRDVARDLDALIVRTVPGVIKAVKWNSPFYGVDGQGWFLNFHCFTKYIKVAFFKGSSLRPVPPGDSKHPEVRYLDIHEDDEIDQKQLAAWITQAAAIPGWSGSSSNSSGFAR
ncbi:MAG: DUF1801 domain-containing protein [Cyanobacteria bacterium]|nr:DUF1801 domain-containing protein [Cyanobacteriota bacterium]